MRLFPAKSRTTNLGPFGEVIRATSSITPAIPIRWSTKYTDLETDLVYYGHRYYNPSTGRWLSRDPVGAAGALNLYCFVKNNPIGTFDVLGLWGDDVHKDLTTQWARYLGIDETQSINIGAADAGIDVEFNPMTITEESQSWHFNRSLQGDSRFTHRDEELEKARQQCTRTTDNPFNAAAFLGRALHPYQDWVAHGDYNRKSDVPDLNKLGLGYADYWHNFADKGIMSALYPDAIGLDANGPNGIPTASVMHWTQIGANTFGWTEYHAGTQRLSLTEGLSKGLLGEFQAYVREHAKPCGECRKAFLGGK